MDIYSDWIVVGEDRKCDLDRYKKVKVIGKSSTPEEAEKYSALESWTYRDPDGKWLNYVFAYKTLIGPQKSEAAYSCYMRFNDEGSPDVYDKEEAPSFVNRENGYVRGIAREVSINGAPSSFSWKACT